MTAKRPPQTRSLPTQSRQEQARAELIASDAYGNRSEAYEAFDDLPLNPDVTNAIGSVIARRFGRREMLRGALGVSASAALFGGAALVAGEAAAQGDAAGGSAPPKSRFLFEEIAAGVDETHHIAEGYEAEALLRWGDPLFPGAPAFDPETQNEASQLRQFGYNSDYVGFAQLDPTGRRGLLCVNHEYTNEELMFPRLGRQDRARFEGMTREIARIEMAAHGGSVVEIAHSGDGRWKPVLTSPFNRRITASTTPMRLDGPAAGHPRMRTTADPKGLHVLGTLNNCAGGMTPWGTWLMAEENFHGYFWASKLNDGGAPVIDGPEAKNWERYGVPGRWYAWGMFEPRFDIHQEPNEPNRFGWIVEVDPFNPFSQPVKRTALGRFRHEGAEPVLSPDGHVVVYCGDDARFEYVYKFVSKGRFDPANDLANRELLSEGTLYAARFNDDGSLDWLPLVLGEGPLTAENGFATQADILIDARLAADALGATPMDRPEDAQPRGDGTVYVMLTNNAKRSPFQVNAANPRALNAFGHIVEIKEAGGDHAATKGRWEILLRCGDPSIAEIGALWNPATSENGWFASPDNAAMDSEGRLWIATDQGRGWGQTGRADGLYAVETEGALRGASKLFFRAPVGAEVCGPYFTPDDETLFLAVQHPGSDGTKDYPPFARASSFEDPATRWPDFDPALPPRPSVLSIRKKSGGRIAG